MSVRATWARMASTRLELLVAALAPLLLAVGCPVDDRELRQGRGSSNVGNGPGTSGYGGAAGGANSGGSGAVEGTGNEAGAGALAGSTAGGIGGSAGNDLAGTGGVPSGGAAGAPDSEGCPDLDENGTGDCDETLVKNAGFDSGADGWTADMFVQPEWVDEDGLEYDASGSLTVVNQNFADGMDGYVMGGVWQCLPATADQVYVFLTQVRVPSSEMPSYAGIGVLFFDQVGCQGPPTGRSSPLLSATSGFAVNETTAQAPANARSMRVRLTVNKPFSAASFSAAFDNVLVRPD